MILQVLQTRITTRHDATLTVEATLDGKHWFEPIGPVQIVGKKCATCESCEGIFYNAPRNDCRNWDLWQPKSKPKRVTGLKPHTWLFDDFSGTGQEPKREEPDMPSLTTYAYEVLVTEKRDVGASEKVLREAKRIAHVEGVLSPYGAKPNRECILLSLAETLNAYKDEAAITDPGMEVVVNIRPFCG